MNMENFEELSRAAFVTLYSKLPMGYVRFKDTDNYKVYANRFGDVLMWKFTDNGDSKEIISKALNFRAPWFFDENDWSRLEDITRDIYHWRGGLKKLKYYQTLSTGELCNGGIDPFFYGYLLEHGADTDMLLDDNKIAAMPTLCDFKVMKSTADALGIGMLETMGDFIESRLAGTDASTWRIQKTVLTKEDEIRKKIDALVDPFIDQARIHDTQYVEHFDEAKNEIFDTMVKVIAFAENEK